MTSPLNGKSFRGTKLKTLRVRSGRHFIYHRFNDQIFLIVRVLHERMAQDQHLA